MGKDLIIIGVDKLFLDCISMVQALSLEKAQPILMWTRVCSTAAQALPVIDVVLCVSSIA
jgi:hypothetical protein